MRERLFKLGDFRDVDLGTKQTADRKKKKTHRQSK